MIRIIQNFSVILIFLVLVTSCNLFAQPGTTDTGSTSTLLSGKLLEWGETDFAKADPSNSIAIPEIWLGQEEGYVDLISSTDDEFLSVSLVEADGSFEIDMSKFRDPETHELLDPITLFQMNDDANCKGRFNVTPLVGLNYLNIDIFSNNEYVGYVIKSSENGDVEWWYAPEDTTITGSRQCTYPGNKYEIIMNTTFSQGWNLLEITHRQPQNLDADFNQDRYSVKASVLGGVWHYFQDFEDPIYFQDNFDQGSNLTLLKPKLAYPETIASPKFRVLTGDIRSLYFEKELLAEADISADHFANITLPNKSELSTEVLSTLSNFDITEWIDRYYNEGDCSGADSLLEPTVDYLVLNPAIYDGTEVYSTVSVESEAGTVYWIYADANFASKGIRTCDGETTDISLDFKEGWNILLEVGYEDESGNIQWYIETIQNAPENMRWITTAYTDVPELENQSGLSVQNWSEYDKHSTSLALKRLSR